MAGLAGCVGLLGEESDEEADGPDRDTGTIRVAVDNTPGDADFNEWSDSLRNAGVEYLSEIAAPVSAEDRELVTSGRTFDAPWIDDRDEVSVPAMLADYRIEPPAEVLETYDDGLTYWDGTPLDAEARYMHDKLTWWADENGANAADPNAEFGGEVVDQWTYRRSVSPSSEPVLEAQVFDVERVPMHPGFTRPYFERLEDATTESEAAQVVQELREATVTLEDLVENGWGSGLYRIESTDDVDGDSADAYLRDDHPIEHAAVDHLEIVWATADQQVVAAERGGLDLGGGVVEATGDVSRATLPDHVQQIDSSRSTNGDKLLFNWNDHHLQRLWVRRAIVALVDWHAVGRQGWGEQSSLSTQYDTGLHSAVSEVTFEEDFLGNLYRYPREYDLETAIDWLERAGYEGSREDGWTSPEGEPLELTITVDENVPEHLPACRTIRANLESAGIDATVEVVPEQPDFASATSGTEPTFQLAMLWDSASEPWEYYWAMGDWWASRLLGGSQDNLYWIPQSGYGEVDTYGVPLDPEVPREVGSIDAPDRAGRSPDLADGETAALPPAIHGMRSPETDEETLQEYYRRCARFYNFYLPQFRFHDIAWGVWGNVRDFEFPPEGHPANRITKGEFSGHDYLVLAGLPQPSPDLDYPDPTA